MDRPVILHIPHSAIEIPDIYLADYTVTAERLAAENLKLTDLYTDELYQLDGAFRTVFPVSRFLVDAERFADDSAESMAARGMGVLYAVDTDLKPIRPALAPARREEILSRYYRPHHHALDEAASAMIARFGYCLVIDCHSYPSRPLPYEMENSVLPRPQIGIGTDPFHTPAQLGLSAADFFDARGYQTGIDVPFSGTLVPSAFYGKDPRVMSLMIEIRKDLYLDEENGLKNHLFEHVRQDMKAILADLGDIAEVLAKDIKTR